MINWWFRGHHLAGIGGATPNFCEAYDALAARASTSTVILCTSCSVGHKRDPCFSDERHYDAYLNWLDEALRRAEWAPPAPYNR